MISIGVLVALSLISATLFYTNNQNWDPPNWVTLVVEVGVGIGIANSILVYEITQQKKSKREQERITELIKEIKNNYTN